MSDLLGGAVNTIYHAAKALEGLTAAGRAIDSHLPARIPLGNPNTTSYGAGGFYAGFASLFIPGGAEADAARGADILGNLSREGAAEEDFIDLYHGTGPVGEANIRSGGIDLRAGRANRDFGQGFYTTRLPAQAARWASDNFGDSGTVLHYRVPASMFGGLSGKVFPDANGEYLDMVSSMRSGGMHSFDYVEGPVLRNPRDFLAGKEPITFGNQISFNSETSVNVLNGYLLP